MVEVVADTQTRLSFRGVQFPRRGTVYFLTSTSFPPSCHPPASSETPHHSPDIDDPSSPPCCRLSLQTTAHPQPCCTGSLAKRPMTTAQTRTPPAPSIRQKPQLQSSPYAPSNMPSSARPRQRSPKPREDTPTPTMRDPVKPRAHEWCGPAARTMRPL